MRSHLPFDLKNEKSSGKKYSGNLGQLVFLFSKLFLINWALLYICPYFYRKTLKSTARDSGLIQCSLLYSKC